METWWDYAADKWARIDQDRLIMNVLLGIVAVAAAVISFDAQRELAELAGFSSRMSWLVPVVVDAGAAAGTRVWLTRMGRTRSTGRALALLLIAVSIASNGFAHWLSAYQLDRPWWLVPAVAAIAPIVLAAVVHLAVLVSQARAHALAEAERDRVERELAERLAAQAEADAEAARQAGAEAGKPGAEAGESANLSIDGATQGGGSTPEPAPEPVETFDEKAARLIAEGYGRNTLARELGVEKHVSRRLIDAAKRNGSAPESTPEKASA